MTELDCGEGRACWMTMLVSWLPIRECWCWPGPVWPCSEILCGCKQVKQGDVKELQSFPQARQIYSVRFKQINWGLGLCSANLNA